MRWAHFLLRFFFHPLLWGGVRAVQYRLLLLKEDGGGGVNKTWELFLSVHLAGMKKESSSTQKKVSTTEL